MTEKRHPPSIKTELRKVGELLPYANNARTHTSEQIDQIVASIREFGWTNPLIVHGNTVIAGHARLEAAKHLKMKQVPVIDRSDMSEAQWKAYVLADNQLAQNATWNEGLLTLELDNLLALDFDLDLIGFEDLDALMGNEPEEGLTDPDEIPEPPAEAITQPGDLWILGDHKLLCGDSTDAATVAYLMDGAKAALVHADPPYGMGKENDGIQNDNLYREKLDAFQMAWWKAVRPHVDDNGSAYIWGNAPDLWRLWYLGGLNDSERLTFRTEITWQQEGASWGKSGMSDLRMYAQNGERCLFFMLGEQGFNNNADNYWDGWEPIRAYLDGEREKMGWDYPTVKTIAGHSPTSGMHWFDRSQWSFITQDVYKALQKAAKGKAFNRPYDSKADGLKQDHDRLKQDHDRLKQDFYETRAYFNNTHDNMTDVWDFDRVKGDERHGHATPKPVAMMERAMKSSLPDGGICYEPFIGSGSTLIAAQSTGRKCYGMELTPAYCDVTVSRYENFSGKKAVLHGRT
jgi:DNA modification methylase